MKYALKYNICPFEYSLDLSYFCDAIICDYNYVFDPKAHLIRYFEDTEYQPKILCDESHNLVEDLRICIVRNLIHYFLLGLKKKYQVMIKLLLKILDIL